MNHTITVGGLLLSIGAVGGLGCLLFGLLSLSANMMADAAGDDGKSGCITVAFGAVLLVGCISGLLR